MSTFLRVTELSVGYSAQQELLTHISFTAQRGELLALLGRNGVGKTTLLKTLAGHIIYRRGAIEIEGEGLSSLSLRQRARQVSYTPSRLQFEPLTTVEEFIWFGRFASRGWLEPRTAADRLAIKKAIEAVRVTHLLNKHLAEISDGERQRVSIAMSLAQDATLLLLDEPTAYLDFVAKRELVALLQEVAHTQNRVILYATHDLELACTHADRFLWVADSTLREVSQRFLHDQLR